MCEQDIRGDGPELSVLGTEEDCDACGLAVERGGDVQECGLSEVNYGGVRDWRGGL